MHVLKMSRDFILFLKELFIIEIFLRFNIEEYKKLNRIFSGTVAPIPGAQKSQ